MVSYPIAAIAQIIEGKHSTSDTDNQPIIRFLSFDSRTILSGKDTLFFAIKTERSDGHYFLQDAIIKGVKCFVVEALPDDYLPHFHYIVVENSLEALQKLAAYHRLSFNFPVVGITGSNGKTIVKEWLWELLSPELKIVKSPRSYNSQIGTPISVWLMDHQFEMGIFEAGISKPYEMDKLEAILKPDYGIITHIGKAHLENFKSTDKLIAEKIKLFINCSLLVYCHDLKLLSDALASTTFKKNIRLFSWSFHDNQADLVISGLQTGENSTLIKGVYRSENLSIEIPFTDDASIENAIHCWAFLIAINCKSELYRDKFKQLAPVAMRLELKKGINGCILINDSYNSDTASLINALDFIEQQSENRNKRCTVVISDILQSGERSENLYKEIAEYIHIHHIQRIIGIGPEISRFQDLFKTVEKKFFPSGEEFFLHYHENDFQNEVILLKGARSFRFDRISALLQEKAHQTVMEIDLDAMVHNLNFYRSKLIPGTKIMAMVKAFSYGTGSVEIAKILQHRRIDYLAVAIADEGIELRNSGIKVPIVVMNPEEHSFDAMIENRLEPNIYRFQLLEKFDEALRRNAVNNFPVHIKVDTGMKRLGFDSKEELVRVAHLI